MYEDKISICKDCSAEFEFTIGEQESYAEKGFTNEPQRCKACRSDHKDPRGGSSSGRAPREMYTVVCASCSTTCKVSFRSRGERPTYCSNYLANRR